MSLASPEMSSPPAELQAVLSLARGDELCRLVRDVGERAAAVRQRDTSEILHGLSVPTIAQEDAETPLGNILGALVRACPSTSERALLGMCLARGISLDPPAGVDAEDATMSQLLWLAAHTPLDALPFLDVALGGRATGLWGALVDLLRRIDAGREASFDRADAFVGAIALRVSENPEARGSAYRLADEVNDASLAALLRGTGVPGGPEEAFVPIVGELVPTFRSPALTAFFGVTGILFFLHVCRAIGRLVLARKRPTEVTIASGHVHVKTRTEMLGKTVSEQEHVLPVAGLLAARREVRYPRLGLYAGLLGLVLGAFVGVRFLVDGARAASPSLLASGLVLLAVGIAAELLVTTILPGARGRCRLVLVPANGATLCVAELDAEAADRALVRLR
jgi:hypothetical protein